MNSKIIDDYVNYLRNNLYSDEQIKVIISIAAHETAGFTSKLCKQYNNCFGFGVPHSWTSRRNGSINMGAYQYSTYSSYIDSLKDYLFWCNRYVGATKGGYIGVNPDLYEQVKLMKRKHYYEDSLENYYKGCLFWCKKIRI